MNITIKYIITICFIFILQISCYSIEEETLIIFDASVSMLDNLGGKPKYLTAIDEAKNVLNMLPKTKRIGLRTIGVTFDSAVISLITNPSEICKATKLVVPIGTNNIEYIKNSLDSIFPLGTTPLTYTLDLAINYDFTKLNSLKHIILVTDGAESCNGDPCKYIRNIMRTRKDIKIDIIAIGVNAEDFKQLKCLTDTTYGTIINIQKPYELKNAFNQFLSPDLKNFENYKNNMQKNKKNIIYKNYLIETYE